MCSPSAKARGRGLAAKFSSLALLPILGVLAAGLTLWAACGFETAPFPLATYWRALSVFIYFARTPQTAFLLGQLSPTGCPGDYLFVLAVKTPLTVLIGACCGTSAWIARWVTCSRRSRRGCWPWARRSIRPPASLFVHLDEADGPLAAAYDVIGHRYPLEPLPPSGDYQLVVGLYALEEGGPRYSTSPLTTRHVP